MQNGVISLQHSPHANYRPLCVAAQTICCYYRIWILYSFFLCFFFIIALFYQNLHSLFLPGNKRDRIETYTQSAE